MRPGEYEHVRCKCGGVIGSWDRKKFTCETCKTEYPVYKLDYDVLAPNPLTGWLFPVKIKEKTYG